ncbi:MAG: hypothetical protein KDD62_05350 [Bdellovibrionales bacterium]|nr:hypothetical protein [Bdellovibrionales bacterium]
MIFWSKSKKQHPLPKFPDTIIPTFQSLCEVISDEEVEELKTILHSCLRLALEKSASNPNFDLPGAEALVNCSLFLLDGYANYSEEAKRMVTGAVRYFAIGDDPFDDEIFATGLYDDKRVMNHVLEELEIHDRYLNLEY